MEITIAKNYGFCSGVKKALNEAKKVANENKNTNIYMLNKIVHNDYVVDLLKKDGIKIIENDLSDEEKIKSIKDGILIFSAHGHDGKLDLLAKKQNLRIVDTTCPKVLLNFKQIKNALLNNKNVIYIGVKNHPETKASLSISDKIIFLDFFNPDYSLLNNLENVSVHNQTTLIQTDLKNIYQEITLRCKNVEFNNEICFATTLRQQSLQEITDEDVIFIIGDKISSNSTRLFELCKKMFANKDVYQISSLLDIKNINLSQYKKGFITAGASTPDFVINPIIEYLQNY